MDQSIIDKLFDQIELLQCDIHILQSRQTEINCQLFQQQKLNEQLLNEIACLKASRGDTPDKPVGLPKLTRLEEADCKRIVKLRVDHFDNGTEKRQGRVRFKAKVFVWFDEADTTLGSIQPLPYDLKLTGNGDKTGGLVDRSNGTRKVKDHTILISDANNTCELCFGGYSFDCGEYEANPKRKNTKAATKRWYWNKPDD